MPLLRKSLVRVYNSVQPVYTPEQTAAPHTPEPMAAAPDHVCRLNQKPPQLLKHQYNSPREVYWRLVLTKHAQDEQSKGLFAEQDKAEWTINYKF